MLPKEEPEAQALIAARLRDEGVDVRLGAAATRVDAGEDGAGRVLVERDGQREHVDFDRILVGTGRRPDVRDLGLDAAGVELDDRGAVRVDDTLRTTAKGVFAGGDVTGSLPFTHVAGRHGP